MAISTDDVDGSLLSPRIETLKAQPLVFSSSSLPNEVVCRESMDNSPSSLNGISSISAPTTGSDKTLDRPSPSSHNEVRGDHCLNSQLPNSIGSSSVIPIIPHGQALVPSSSNSGVLNEQSTVDTPIETRDFESVVSTNGTESPPSSPVDPSSRKTLLDEEDCNDHNSAMHTESKEDPSSLPVSWELLAEEHNEGNFDDTGHNLVTDDRTSEASFDSSYHSCNCNSYNRFNHQWGRSCGPHCESYRPFYDPWRASRGHWGSDREDKPLSLLLPEPTGVGAGLSNLGNTCFLNAILQCFTHTVPLVKALRSSNHSKPCKRGFEGFCVVCALCDHIQLSMASSGKIIAPSRVVDNLHHISSCFHRYHQEDAHEFLQCLLDKLERCCVDSNQNETSSMKDDNIVERVFGGRLVSKLRCCNCAHCSDKYEPLIDLSLEIEDVETLQSALESFTKVEKIDDIETKFRCDNCEEEVSMEKQLMLDQTPSVAAFHLKRFKTDGSYIEKIGKHVQFPLELDLKPYTDAREDCHEPQVDLKYQLYAIVVHNGFLPASGHYFSYIRSSPGTWHKLDDSMVIKVEEETVLSEAAYILFYVREGSPWFSSLMEMEKDGMYPRSSNTSPKSVLDKMDTECAACPPVEDINLCKASVNRGDVEGTSTPLSCAPVVEEAQISQIGNDAEESRYVNESSNDVPMNDVSVSHEVEATKSRYGSLHDEKFGSLVYAEESNGGQVVHRIGRNDVLDPGSSSPDMNVRVKPEARHGISQEHLKLESAVINEKMKKSTRDQRTEAVRYLRNNSLGSSSRSAKLLKAMIPRGDQKKRIRSSPCKQGSPSDSRVKFPRREAVFR